LDKLLSKPYTIGFLFQNQKNRTLNAEHFPVTSEPLQLRTVGFNPGIFLKAPESVQHLKFDFLVSETGNL